MRAAVLLLASTAFAADSDFLGRWNLTVTGEPRARAWWLEVSTPSTGRFVGFPGGDMNPIPDLRIAGNEITFSYQKETRAIHYRARVARGVLTGAATEGSKTMTFTGKRAPEITDTDGPAWRRGKPIDLFNGRDLAGWSAAIPGKPLGWDVKNGVLVNTPAANNLVSSAKFWNFELHAEYKLREQSNSGIGLRARYEVQIQDDFGKAPESHGHGAIYSRITPASNPSRKPGEWQTLDVRLVGRTVTVKLNGVTIIHHKPIEGLTAVATDADEAAPGPITIQGDHREVEFRKLTVTPLTRQ